jgi:pyruvate-formate lyase-activating enzyme
MDYYCSTKFTDLHVHVQGRMLYNCCMAYPERVSIDWLEKNPGKLFYTDTMIADRKLMLENKSCASCHHGCYKHEEKGILSARQQQEQNANITDVNAPLQHLQISLSTDCNLTCMYCGPEWSTSWYKNIEANGPHKLKDFTLENTNFTKLWSKMKQKSRSSDSTFFKLLLKEIALSNDLKRITLLGGEPLLNNKIDDLITQADGREITIVTGLGVSNTRLAKILKAVRNKNINFNVSAEATGRHFELLRAGVRWQDFKDRVAMISDNGHSVEFDSTISNISVFDFTNFLEFYGKHYKVNVNTMTERPFLMPNVLDQKSKETFIMEANANSHIKQLQDVRNLIGVDANDDDRRNIGAYLQQFASRRSIDIGFLPEHFREWCLVDITNNL